MLWLQRKSSESNIELKKIEIQDVDRLYEYTETSVKNNIRESFLIPPVLLLQTAGKLGTATEIRDATAYYNGITYHERLIVEEIFKAVFENFYPKINLTGNYSIIPVKPSIADIEIQPSDLSSILSVLASPISYEQKIEVLRLTFNISEELAIKIAGVKQVTE